MGRFASTAAFYAEVRPPYGPAFFAEVARRRGFDGTGRLLDLGTGPGLLAIGFASVMAEVVGVDPEPAMLEAARSEASRASVALGLVAGRAEDLTPALGRFDAVTIGRALHWLDPGATCRALDAMVAPRGCVLVCRSGPVGDGRNPWLPAYDAARRRWGETGASARDASDREAFFSGSRFRFGETITSTFERDVAVEHLVDRVLSMSSTSPERVGHDIEALRAAVGAALAPFCSAGRLREVVEARADVFEAEG